MNEPVAVILAAGQGTRMKSDLPKVLHRVHGRPMIEFVLDAARKAGATRLVVVVGYKADEVREALAGHDEVEFALQSERKGTGHAVMMCERQLSNHNGPVIILAGDTPLLRGESLAVMLTEQQHHQAACVVGTAETDANEGLGRIVRDGGGNFLKIVEQNEALPEELSIREINSGCFVFDRQSLFWALSKVRPNNKKGEYYLTDCVEILKSDGRTVIASCSMDIQEAMGVNTPSQLADVEKALARRNAPYQV